MRSLHVVRGCVSVLALLVCFQVSPPCWAEQQPVSELIEMLRSDDRDKRRDAANTLASYGPEAEVAVDALIEALEDRDIQIWHDATQALAHLGPKAAPALDALIENMGNADEQRRFRTSYAIGSIGTAALPAMRERLTDDSSRVRESATRAIGLMGPDAAPAVPDLIERLGDDGTIRDCAVASLAQIGPEGVTTLQRALRHDDPRIRSGAARALGAIGTPGQPAVPDLISLSADDSDASVRAASVAALGRVAPDRTEIVEPLINALQDGSNDVTRAAVEAWIPVSGTVQAEATPRLAELLRKQDDQLRNGVLLVLNRFGPRAGGATPVLIDELAKNPESVELTTTLGQIGTAALEPTYAALRDGTLTPAQVTRIVQGMPSTLKRQIARAVDDESHIIRELAASTLGQLVPLPRDGVELLSRGLADEVPGVRLASARSTKLNGRKANAIEEKLLAAIQTESDATVRSEMLQALASIEPDQDQLIGCLAENLGHNVLEVRIAALKQLAKQEQLPESLQSQLSERLSATEAEIRALSLESLSLIKEGKQRSAELIMQHLSDSSEEVTQQAMRSLARLGDEAIPALDRIQLQLDAESQATRLAAIESLSELGKRSNAALDKFKELASAESPEVRDATLKGVRRISEDPEAAVQILIGGLKDSEWEVRRTAMQELGKLEERASSAVPALLKMLSNERDGNIARSALRDIGTADEDALPPLMDIVQNGGRRSKYYALYILRKMGPKAKSVLPVLKELREETDGSLGSQFDRTINELESDEED